MFSSSTYAKRRAALAQQFSSGYGLILGNSEAPRNYKDNVYPFRQDSSFLYYFGHAVADMAGLFDFETGRSYLIGNPITLDHIIWMGDQPSLDELSTQVGADGWKTFAQLEDLLKGQASIHMLPPYRAENENTLKKLTGRSVIEPSVPFIKAVIAQRVIKSAEEITEMEKAVDVSADMHIAAMQAGRAGVTEAYLAGLIEGIALQSGGKLAYNAILTINGHILHNHDHSHTVQNGQLVLGDFGAETALTYAGDITRTFPVSGQFTDQQKAIYQLVLDAQMQTIEAIKPGIENKTLHLMAAKTIASGLKDLGIMQGDVDEAVAAGAHALFFPHGLGHMIGLDVHDMEDLGEDLVGYTDQLKRSTQFGLKSLRLGRALETGHVITIEPGCYFIPKLIDHWQETGTNAQFINFDELQNWRNFSGIRIEDNILVTEAGYRLLGKPIPKTIAEVEATCAS